MCSNHVLYFMLPRFIFQFKSKVYSLQFVFVGLCPQFMWCIPHYRGLSSCFYLYAGCILCISYVCWTLSSDDVVYSTLQRVILLFFFFFCFFFVFIYVQGVFLAISISAGLCPSWTLSSDLFVLFYGDAFPIKDNTFRNALILPSFFCLLYLSNIQRCRPGVLLEPVFRPS